MKFEKRQKIFPSATHQSIRHAALFMAPFYGIIPPECRGKNAAELAEGEKSLNAFMQDLYCDMYSFPEAYFLPIGEYDGFMKDKESSLLTAREAKQESFLRNMFQRSIQFYQKLLFEIGVQASPQEGSAHLRLPKNILNDMFFKYNLRIIRVQPEKRWAALSRMGLTIDLSGRQATVSVRGYPNMLLALAALCRSPNRKFVLTHFLRCDFRGLMRSHVPGFEDAVSILPGECRKIAADMDAFLQHLKCKISVQPLKNTTLYSKWKVAYRLKNRAVYGFHADTDQLDLFAYFNRPENISRMGYALREESARMLTWFYEHIPARTCACRNNRRVDIGGREKRICGLMNRLELVNPNREDFEKLKKIIDLFLGNKNWVKAA